MIVTDPALCFVRRFPGLMSLMPNTKETQGYHGLAFCGDESMILRTPYNEKRRPVQVRRFSRKARHPHRDALTTSYTTYQSAGSIRASGGRHSLTDIARHSLPDLEKPVLWWRHREARRTPQGVGGNGRPGHP